MSKTHPYRVQLHCSKQLSSEIKEFAEQRGLSQSSAARLLVERSLNSQSDDISVRLDELFGLVNSVLHTSIVSRVLAAEAVLHTGSNLSREELKGRVGKLIERYKRREVSS